jgi:anti-sigma regulatory factor (Ser/Thr protein kinase)
MVRRDSEQTERSAVTEVSGVFAARMEAFPRVAALVEEAGAAAGFGREDRLRLRLVVEELFTNTVAHGHGQDSDAPVRLVCAIRPGEVTLTYEDSAPPYDPLGPGPSSEATLAAEHRPPGGFGVALVASLARDLRYTYANGKNRLLLTVRSQAFQA